MTESEVDSRVELWHSMPRSDWERLGCPSLHAFLGFTWDEYARWVQTGEIPQADRLSPRKASNMTLHFYKGEEDAYVEEASKGTLPVYHHEQRGPATTVEVQQEDRTETP